MKKNKLFLFAVLGLLVISLSACSDYLNVDKYFKDRMTEEKLFESKDYSEKWLAAVYSYLDGENMDVCSKEASLHNFSDDMYFMDLPGQYSKFKDGMYDESYTQNSWGDCYAGIRNASTFIRSIHVNKELSSENIADYRAQARFLRAYYYWLLLRKYGPVPLIPDGELDYTEDYESLSLPRSSYEECTVYVAEELALAARDLPLKRTDRTITWPTRGAALAARAKVLLYAASPLANGNTEMAELTDHAGRQLIAQEYDESKWARAAAAAKDLIELSAMNSNLYQLYVAPRKYNDDGGRSYPKTIVPPRTADNETYMDNDWPNGWKNIDPFESYRSMLNGDVQASSNPELIFTRGMNDSGRGLADLVEHQVPFQAKGKNCHGMTLKQCDAYYMNDGTDMPGKDDCLGRGDGSQRVRGFVTEENKDQYKPLAVGVSLQFANREPRFYASVAYNGSVWDMITTEKEELRYYQSSYYYGSDDGYNPQSPEYSLCTGIGIKKFYNPQDSYLEGGRQVKKIEPAIRYADVLLIYAEALNELVTGKAYDVASWDGAQTYSIRRNVEDMKAAVAPIRIRGGVPNYKEEIYNDAVKLRKALKRERQIEFFAEGQRYYDLRRWKDAPVEEATPVYGYNVYVGDNDKREQFYTPTVVSSIRTVFVRKMYFWPFSHGELKKNRKLTQNPGWTYYD